MLETQVQPQDTLEPQKRRPGAWGPALAQSCPWAQALAASFVVPGYPWAAPGFLAYEYGSQFANLEKVPVVDFTDRISKANKIEIAIILYLNHECAI